MTSDTISDVFGGLRHQSPIAPTVVSTVERVRRTGEAPYGTPYTPSSPGMARLVVSPLEWRRRPTNEVSPTAINAPAQDERTRDNIACKMARLCERLRRSDVDVGWYANPADWIREAGQLDQLVEQLPQNARRTYLKDKRRAKSGYSTTR